MAIELATAYVSLTTSAKGISGAIEKDLAPVSKKAAKAGKDSGKEFSGGFGSMAAAAGGILAGIGVVDFFKDSVTAASDLNETVSKSGIIFGKNAGSIDKWASNAASKMGLSKQAALESAASFGDMFSQIGIAGDQAASMSQQVVQMSADLGSFNNLPTADVVDMISGAFRGEYDSLQRVIPNINAARVESQALAMTHKKSAKELTAAEKATAVMAIVQKDGARASGDFARTSDGLANSQKILAAKIEDSKAKIGKGLTPVVATLTQFLADSVVPAMGELFGWLGKNSESLKTFGMFLAPLLAMWITYAAVTKVAAIAQGIFNAVMAANPIVLIIALIVALVVAFVLAYKKVAWFRDGVNTAFAAVKNAIGAVIDWVTATWPKVWDAVKAKVTDVKNWIVARFNDVVAFVTGLPGRITTAATGLWDSIKNAVTDAYNWVAGQLNAMITFVAGLPGRVATAASGLWNSIKNSVTDAYNWVKTKLDAVITFVAGLPGRVTSAASGLWGGIKSSVTDAYNWVKGKLDGIVSYVAGLPGRISGTVGKVFEPLRSAAISALNGIATAWNATLGGMGISVPGWVPGIGGNSFSFPNMPHFARGGWLPSGWSVVGELGPELVHKAGGSARVFSTTASRNMLDTDSGQRVSIDRLVEFSGPVSVRSDQDLLDLSRGIARETNRRLRALGTSVSLSGAKA